MGWLSCLFLAWLALAGPLASAEPRPDREPRVAIVSAFEAELALLRERVQEPTRQRINGIEFTTGTLEGRPVVLFLSGRSMVNAAMNLQLALDRYQITHVLFSGVAGGVNPALGIGDVVVPEQWGQYLEVRLARETAPGVYALPPGKGNLPNFGMIHPRPVEVRSAARPEPERRFWFPVDEGMLEAARELEDIVLDRCDERGQCLEREPKLVVGGNGVSGSAFVDNAAFREYLSQSFQANVLDMESAACAIVAYSNGVPFLAFRSLSDLAGGGEGENEIEVFRRLAAANSSAVLLAFLRQWR